MRAVQNKLQVLAKRSESSNLGKLPPQKQNPRREQGENKNLLKNPDNLTLLMHHLFYVLRPIFLTDYHISSSIIIMPHN